MNKSIITLSQILVAEIEGRATNQKVQEAFFDCRTDLVVTPKVYALAVELTFFNEGWNRPDYDKALRRKLMLTVADAESGNCVSMKKISFSMPGCLMHRKETVHIPFKAAQLPLDHDYELVVCDQATAQVLGRKRFHVYGTQFEGRNLSDVYQPVCAGLIHPCTGGLPLCFA